jgi:hypothetical protein
MGRRRWKAMIMNSVFISMYRCDEVLLGIAVLVS